MEAPAQGLAEPLESVESLLAALEAPELSGSDLTSLLDAHAAAAGPAAGAAPAAGPAAGAAPAGGAPPAP